MFNFKLYFAKFQHYKLGLLYEAQDRREEALQCYQAALSLDASQHDVLQNLAQLLDVMGKKEEAIAAYREILSVDPARCEVLSSLAHALRATGQVSEAISVFKQVVHSHAKTK